MIPEPILFVFGPARGGTTFVNNLLAKWFGYTMGPEGTFVVPLYRMLPRNVDLADDGNLDRLLCDVAAAEMFEIMRSKWPERARVDIDAASIRRHLHQRSYAGAVHAALSALREERGRVRLGIKSPDYWMELDDLETIFGTQARYLFVVRDGRDVALSNFRVSWGQRNAYVCARRWVRMLDTVESFQRRLDPGRLLTIRYEDILQSPDSAIATLERFLEVALPEGQRDQLMMALAGSPLRSNYDKWRQGMSGEQLRAYESVAAGHLSRHGYAVANSSARLSALEVARFWAQETLRKVVATVRKDILGRG